jgi:hypothetical protein
MNRRCGNHFNERSLPHYCRLFRFAHGLGAGCKPVVDRYGEERLYFTYRYQGSTQPDIMRTWAFRVLRPGEQFDTMGVKLSFSGPRTTLHLKGAE